MRYYALWLTRDGRREFDGPFDTDTEARQAMPGTAQASLVTRPVPMTFGEYLDALPILEPRVQEVQIITTLTSPEVPEIDPRVSEVADKLGIPRRRP
jgi:hypothetical protein